MRWRVGVAWFTACVLTTTRGQFLTIDHFETPIPEDVGTENPVDHNSTLHQDESVLKTNISSSTRDLDSQTDDSSNSDNFVVEEILSGESPDTSDNTESISEERESQEPRSSEEHPPNENPRSTENISPAKSSGSSSQENPPLPPSNEHVSGENSESGEHLSAERPASNETPESGASVGARSSESLQESDARSTSDDETSASDTGDEVKHLVQTTHGPVKGHEWQGGANIISYLDIPYGKFDAPFEAPHTAQSWVDIHDVPEHNKRCPQYQSDSYEGDINCLTLSIFKPVEADNASVLFYVHDTDFGSGDPSFYGPEHLVSKGVILVLPNYRFGVLGFLCLQNETAPGNAGLKDLSQALEWIRDNIQIFGGNPSNIVVGGDGNAGALVGLLALGSRSKHYISKVITESGSMLSHLAIDRNPASTATRLADKIRNDHSGDTIYNNVFSEVPVETIVTAAKDKRFNPCIEQDNEPFMDVTPWTSLRNREIDITFMIGSATYAGAHDALATTESFIDNLNADIGLILPSDLSFENSDRRNEHALRVRTQYFGTEPITLSQVKELSLWYTDASYLSPTLRSARLLAEAGAKVYMYEFAFVGSLNRELIALNNEALEGAVRSDIRGYLFTQDGYMPSESEEEEKRLIDNMVHLWVSFINNGIPEAEGIVWNELKATEEVNEEFLVIDDVLRTTRGVHVQRLQLWTELYENYFIERSRAGSLTPGYYVLIALTLVITNTKLHYNH